MRIGPAVQELLKRFSWASTARLGRCVLCSLRIALQAVVGWAAGLQWSQVMDGHHFRYVARALTGARP